VTDADLLAWRDALDAADRPELARLLEHAVVHKSVPGEVVLGFANRFHRDTIGVRDTAAQLAAGLAGLVPGAWRVTVTDDPRARTESPASRSKQSAAEEREGRMAMLRDHVSVQRVRKAFDGQIVDIRLADEGDAAVQAASG
jgi:hypothetical protein